MTFRALGWHCTPTTGGLDDIGTDDDAKKPLTVGINSYVTGYEQNWDQLFAAAIIAIVPVVILIAVIEKHLVGGLTAGSIK